MLIWIINPFDDIPGEGKAQRYHSLALALVEQGHEVVWWSSDFSHRRKSARVMPSEGMSFSLRLISTPHYAKNISLRRIYSHWKFGRNLLHEAKKAVSADVALKPDAIVVSMPPMEVSMIALKLKELYSCRVITDIMDTWPKTFLQAIPGGIQAMVASIVLKPYWRMLRRACRESDGVSAQSEAFADYARANGANMSLHVCYLGAESVEELKVAPAIVDRPLRLIYIGAMGRSYDLETILDAILILKDEGIAVECVFVGDGYKREKLESRGVDGVRFTGFLEAEDLRKELVNSDIGLVPFFPESGVAVPYKVGEYFAHALPVFSTIEGELGQLICDYSCGATYSSGDAGSLANLIRDYSGSEPKRLEEEKLSAYRLFNDVFNRNETYPEMAKWITDRETCRHCKKNISS